MCGISGFNFEDKEAIEKMNTKIAHRGPDAAGIFVSPGISLGHRRLSIIDLSQAANQPMESTDGRYVIVYNGELYNFFDLKKELSGKYEFKTASDTEVVLASFIAWGADCLAKFNGIFAFAIWDKKKQELFLARDRFGVKPLYYYYGGGKFIFASEAKAILEHSFVRRKLNIGALNNYFRFLYVLGPETMWEDIKKLPPGHFAVCGRGELKISRYFELAVKNEIKNMKTAEKMAADAMFLAVKRQLVSDRPVGLFLSGGLDSSVICAAMAREASGPVKTFSVGFDIDIEKEKFNADFLTAQATASHFGTHHHPLLVSASDVRDNFENCVVSMDEPVSNHVQVATYLLAREAKREVAVVLGGDGGDEIFGGYDRYYYADLVEKTWRLAPFLKGSRLFRRLGALAGRKNMAAKFTAPDELCLYLSFMAQKEEIVLAFLLPEYNLPLAEAAYRSYFDRRGIDIASKMMAADLSTWLADESLIRSDKLAMAHGLEERVPFLDNDLVDLAFSIPSKFKLINAYHGKKVLRRAFRGIVPDSVLDQRKRGFFSPAAKWLRTGLKDFAYEILSPNYTNKTDGLFNWTAVKKILDEHIEHKNYSLNTIWSLMTFQVWARNYL